MESSAGALDDQGSGWLEVKKKHRSSSKLSVNNSAGGSSRRNANGKSGTSHGKHVAQLPKSGGELGGRVPEIAPNNSTVLTDDGKDQSCLDKCVVSEVNSFVDTPSLRTIAISNSDASLKDKKVSQEMSTVFQKIKRDDLEDSGFVRHSASEIKFGEIGNDDLARCRKSENLSDVTSSNLSDNQSQINQELVEVTDYVCYTEQRCSSSEIDISLEENCKRVTEVSLSSKEMPASSDRVVDCNDPPDCKEPHDHGAGLIDTDLITADWPSDEGCSLQAVKVADHVSSLTSDLGDTDIPIVISRKSSILMNPQAPETFLPDQSSPDTLQESNPTAPSEACKTPDEKQQAPNMEKDVKDCSSSHNNNNLQGQVSKAQIMNALGEREEGESKERFRERLWCYLFENLNRAVDELYLLCELECDLEQVREAILVLDEAKSDFIELNTRVEEFENTKRNVSHLANVAPVTVKSDRRRPHSLSWEVRRMTTSPHRAEILSSSLEAFKKFQEERGKIRVPNDQNSKEGLSSDRQVMTTDVLSKSSTVDADSEAKPRRHGAISDPARPNNGREKKSIESNRSSKLSSVRTNRLSSQSSPNPDVNGSKLPARGPSTGLVAGKNKREQVASVVEGEKRFTSVDRGSQNSVNDKEKEKGKETEKEKRNSVSWKSMDAWKEKRNWEEILASPCRISSRVSHSPCMSRKSAERARILHDKLMTPDKKKKTAIDLKKEAEEKHARAMRIKREFDNERVQKFQKSSEKLNRVTEWQAVRSMKLKEGMYARHQRSETRHEAYIAQVVKRAGEESVKVNEVRFITSLNDENKKFMLHQRLHGSEMRRAEKLQVLKIKQKEDMAREEAVLERRKLLEAEKLQRLAVIQRKKEEAQVRREEERKASSAAREAKALEQLRRREERAKAQQEEAELLAQKLAERLRESEQRRKFYLEQIRERASMDFRDHSSPLTRRPLSKDGQGRLAVVCSGEDNQLNNVLGTGDSNPAAGNVNPQHLLKRRIKKIRQRLMSLKHDYPELSVPENGLGYRTAMSTARARIGRWLQDLQRCRQARKEGASSIGLITAEMIKFLEGKELELHASRQAGLLDFISSALPASHTSKPEACQVTIYLLRLLKVILSLPSNRSYFLAQNLLPPTIPMLTAALENYIKIAASINSPGSSILPSIKTSEIFDSISEVLDGFLWTVTMIIGHESSDERHFQMQHGLLELVVFYQIIHRLRDLFALHDRPQVEGSPFPSSILLSINLLVALTSRSRTVSSIDWESFSNGNPGSENFIPHDAESANIVGSVVNSSIEEPKGLSSADLHNESQGEQFGECKSKESHDSVSSEVDCSKEQQKNNQTVLMDVDLGTTGALDDSKKNCSAVTCKSSSPQKDDNSMEVGVGTKDEASMCLKAPQGFLLSAISETGLVSLLSLLTAVLLQANNRTSEQPAYVLPSNFEEVAIGVLKVLNNLALMDLTFLQEMLARPDLKMEFFHIMSFLLTHCTSKWKASSDQVGLLLLESLLLLSYFSLFHPGNQAVLRWGKGTTILHKLCDLPFTFFSDPELMPVLAGTLMAACYRCEQNRGVVQQELSTEMLLSLVKSCKNSSQAIQSSSVEDSSESNQITIEPSRKLQSDNTSAQKFGRFSARTTSRSSLARSSVQGGSIRGGRLRNNKESRIGNRVIDEVSLKDRMLAPALMLHSRFPVSFIDRVEQFFSAEISCMDEECMIYCKQV